MFIIALLTCFLKVKLILLGDIVIIWPMVDIENKGKGKTLCTHLGRLMNRGVAPPSDVVAMWKGQLGSKNISTSLRSKLESGVAKAAEVGTTGVGESVHLGRNRTRSGGYDEYWR